MTATPTSPTNTTSSGIWKETPYGGDDWKSNVFRSDAEKTVWITVPVAAQMAETDVMADALNNNADKAMKDGVDAIFAYYKKGTEGLEPSGVSGEYAYKVTNSEGAPVYVGKWDDHQLKPLVEANALPILYKVVIDEDSGWDFFADAPEMANIKTFNFLLDPRSREVGCIDFGPPAIRTALKIAKGNLTTYKEQIKLFREKGGKFKPSTEPDIDQIIKEMDDFMVALNQFLNEDGQGFNLVSEDEGLDLENLYDVSKVKLHVGIDYDYEPYFVILEVPFPNDAVVKLKDLNIPVDNFKASGYSVETPPCFRVNLMTGVEKLRGQKRALGLILRISEFLAAVRQAAKGTSAEEETSAEETP